VADPLIHRHPSALGLPVNAYLLEGGEGVVVVDGLMTVSDGKALREAAEATGKPLLAAVVTHTHPDHYGGVASLVEGLDVPIYATATVREAIERDDADKEERLRPKFGDEWATQRVFPNEVVEDGGTIRHGGVELTVVDLGPGESPGDSAWLLAGGRQAIVGDVVYDRMQCYLADGTPEEWLANLERLRQLLPPGATLYPGHGEPCGTEALDWQRGYIETVLAVVRGADWSQPEQAREAALAAARGYLPSEELMFLLELSIDPLARSLSVA